MLTHIDFLNEQIIELDMEVAKRLAPFQKDLDRLDSISGIAGKRSPPKHVKATNISDPHSSKLLSPYEDLTIISVPSTGELQLAKEGTAQLLP